LADREELQEADQASNDLSEIQHSQNGDENGVCIRLNHASTAVSAGIVQPGAN
jgi:hypothetical protein